MTKEQLMAYFTDGILYAEPLRRVGVEVETQFRTEDGKPIPTEVTEKLLAIQVPNAEVKLELGRQNIELSFQPEFLVHFPGSPYHSPLYFCRCAERLGAYPVFEPAPFRHFDEPLLYIQEERDQVWVDLDGEAALEYLCRCSSVQFTVDVHPDDAIPTINRLWDVRAHQVDYHENDYCWGGYVLESKVGYRSDRYGGPPGFEDLEDYVAQLVEHDVVMHGGRPCRRRVESSRPRC